ncbi:MAG: hypothetical protein HY777_13620 [Betaproteobacteria bacterium]|nr:hypothetical protein [Betaproteobacteria bacterium]
MKRSIVAALLAICLLPPNGALAQGQTQTVYEVRGPNGPVYSDKPMPGARAIELPPLNVMDFKSAGQPATSTAPANPRKPESGKNVALTRAPGYRSLAIMAPEDNGSVVASGAVFEVRLASEPPLLLGDGHAFTVSINGKAVNQRFTATEFMIPPEFWGDSPPPPNQRYHLSAKIVDRDGALLKEASPVVFTLRNAPARPAASSTSVRTPMRALEPEPPSANQAKPKTSKDPLR